MRFPETHTERRIPWGESVRFVWGAIAADKIKASLTALAVLVGSAAIVLVITIASVGKVYVVSQIEGIGANVAYASLSRSGSSVSPLEDELTPEDLVALRQVLPTGSPVAGTYDTPIDFTLQGQLLHARLVGVTPDFGEIRNLQITSGRYFDAEDFRSRAKVCLVTDQLAGGSGSYDSAAGGTIHVDQFRCTIIGTFREGVPTFGRSEIQDATLLIPFPLVRGITGDNFFQVLYAQAPSSRDVPALTRQMAEVLRSRHRPGARYSIENLSSLLETAHLVSLAISGVLLAVALLTLTVAGTGIMNIMLANVSQRIHEIGLRKALGATSAEIRLQFLLEAVSISFVGAMLGVIVALVLLWFGAGLIRTAVPITISWVAVAVALTVSSAVGVLFGYRPASEAASLNPIDALRVE
ncbi:MAG TPA: ABC transporter permease [Terriglobales bacterium]|nr:ABC transporter permease [Terriglobales bacterium]